jgi:ribosomal protein S18 acetylase RimI-like enzyme
MQVEEHMVRLTPMSSEKFKAFLDRDTRDYAAEMVKAGYWTAPSALQRSRQEHRRLLRDGQRSRDHYFYTIEDSDTGQAVGAVWLNSRMETTRPTGYIYVLEIDEPYRRQGYGRQAMQELEIVARGMGLQQLGLHVFAHNGAARALYEGLGYQTASLNLIKSL